MRVISHKKIRDFYEQHPTVKSSLEAFYNIIKYTDFDSFNDLRKTFPSADIVNKCTVFNVGGNKVRVIAAIHYNKHRIYIKWVLTHEEYDKNSWKKECSN
ncbi:type II toxin-antitoxin system HigB family toxin [Beggiatoa leptomitoformis]|uniref:Type II toxin-antitoxin system HigB family toxin n=2 Tax=Beggiatoa leptomitoformis TaxID=288004 RepID=A0A2N9YJA0_9GAMM|nr:type II toxin-antitoxin system HigB family toxin [Beggiatoa leptomitoformis]AUI70597.1 type II toxin-antitoxin system HigB family toxin [Beggiatoa leptomitoformis]